MRFLPEPKALLNASAIAEPQVFPAVPLRQWVISFPFALRYLFAAHPEAMGQVLSIVYRCIATHLVHKAGLRLTDAATGAVTLIQRFGSALNLNIHFHIRKLPTLPRHCCYHRNAHHRIRTIQRTRIVR